MGKTNKIKDKHDFVFKQRFDLRVKLLFLVFWRSVLIFSKFRSTASGSSAPPRVLGRE